VRPRVKVSWPGRAAAPPLADDGIALKLGQHVRHPSFGDGIVVAAEGAGAHTRIQVNFADAGAKWLVLAYANLTPL
jgi:DNA helicase-2/ATP-dependent DNA helicase PcrA